MVGLDGEMELAGKAGRDVGYIVLRDWIEVNVMDPGLRF